MEQLLRSSRSTGLVDVDPAGRLAGANPAFATRLEVPGGELPGRPVTEFLTAPAAERVRSWMEGGEGSLPGEPVRLNFVSSAGAPFTLRCMVGWRDGGLRIVGESEVEEERGAAEELMRLNSELSNLARERARRQRELERTQGELEAALEELRTSYWHLQKIQEVLPLCMSCGKVKTSEAEWDSVVDYLKANQIFLSHGYCPACEAEVLRKYDLEDDAG